MASVKMNGIIDLAIPESTDSEIASLIRRILILEEKLSDPGKQSEYFKWGYESKTRELESLKQDYKRLRLSYNSSTIEYLERVISEKRAFIKETVPSIQPLFARSMILESTKAELMKAKDFLHWKSITQELPQWKAISSQENIIREIWKR